MQIQYWFALFLVSWGITAGAADEIKRSDVLGGYLSESEEGPQVYLKLQKTSFLEHHTEQIKGKTKEIKTTGSWTLKDGNVILMFKRGTCHYAFKKDMDITGGTARGSGLSCTDNGKAKAKFCQCFFVLQNKERKT